MCYIYLLCVSLPVTIMFETTQSIVDPGNFSRFQGVQGNDYVCRVRGLFFGHFTMPPSPAPRMRSIKLKSGLFSLKILKYTCFYFVTGLIKLVQFFFYTYSFRNQNLKSSWNSWECLCRCPWIPSMQNSSHSST